MAGPLLVVCIVLSLLHAVRAAGEPGGDPALVVGIVVWPGHNLTRAQVQLYRDAECTKLAHSTDKVGPQGTYGITVPEPGAYYARVLVDDNASGTRDEGDGIGFYGLSSPAELGKTPRAIELQPGEVALDIIIPVIATIGPDAAPQPLQPGGELPERPSMIIGAVVWPGHDLSKARVRLFTDETLSTIAYESPPVEPGGSFVVVAEPGTYYVCVIVDNDGDGKFGPGDAIGYYGVTDMTDAGQRPRPVTIGPERDTPHMVIPVSAVLTAEGRLRAVEVPESVRDAAAAATPSTRVSGRVTWPGHTFERAWVVAASSPRLRDIVAVARPETQSGAYDLGLPPGEYVLVALVDANDSGRLDAGDCLGFVGGETLPGPEALLTPVRVEAEEPGADANVHVVARLGEDGAVIPFVGKSTDGPAAKLDPASLPALASGRVLLAGEAVKQGSVTFFRNKELSDVASVAPLGPDGAYAAVLPPGAYYVMGGADMDGDDAMSPGDGLGVYGAGRMAEADAREAVHLEAGALRAGLDVRISDVVAESGALEPAGP